MRVQWDPHARVYRGVVVDPWGRWSGTYKPGRIRVTVISPTRSDQYDRAACALIEAAEREALRMGHRLPLVKHGRRIHVERVFQAPCPTDECRARRGRSF